MYEIILKDGQINDFLNLAYLEGRISFTVENPFLDMDLLKIMLKREGWTAKLDLDVDEYREKRGEYRNKGFKVAYKEIPQIINLKSIMIMSGVYGPEDFEDQLEKIKRLLFSSPPNFSVVLDTNVLYNRFISSIFTELLDENEKAKHRLKWKLSSLVRKEINRSYNKKYSNNEIQEMKLYGGDVFGNLYNQPFLRNRLSKFASSELRYVVNDLGADVIENNEWVDEKEKRDAFIVEDYETGVSSDNRVPVLLTFDRDIKSTADNYNIKCLPFEYPDFEEKTIDHHKIADFLTYLIQLNGVIKFNGLGCHALGVWNGMGSDDFYQKKIKLVFENESDLTEKLEDIINVSSKLRKILC